MDLPERVRLLLPDAVEKRMFGRSGFMVEGALACAAGTAGLLVRVDPAEQGALVKQEGVAPMVMGGRRSRGWVEVAPDVLSEEEALASWVGRGVERARAVARGGATGS